MPEEVTLIDSDELINIAPPLDEIMIFGRISLNGKFVGRVNLALDGPESDDIGKPPYNWMVTTYANVLKNTGNIIWLYITYVGGNVHYKWKTQVVVVGYSRKKRAIKHRVRFKLTGLILRIG